MNAENYLRVVARDASNCGPLPPKLIGAYLEEHIEPLVERVGPLASGGYQVSASYHGPWQGLKALMSLLPCDVSFRVAGTASVILGP